MLIYANFKPMLNQTTLRVNIAETTNNYHLNWRDWSSLCNVNLQYADTPPMTWYVSEYQEVTYERRQPFICDSHLGVV